MLHSYNVAEAFYVKTLSQENGEVPFNLMNQVSQNLIPDTKRKMQADITKWLSADDDALTIPEKYDLFKIFIQNPLLVRNVRATHLINIPQQSSINSITKARKSTKSPLKKFYVNGKFGYNVNDCK